MSRYVQSAPHLEKAHELYRKEGHGNKVLILRNGGILYSFLLQDNRIYKAAREEKDDFPIGTMLIGKVSNIAKQLNGAFIQLENAKNRRAAVGYLPLKDGKQKLLCGDEVLVQVVKAAHKTKPLQLSADISLAGQFIVVKKGSGKVNYSKKLKEDEKTRLQEAFTHWKEEGSQMDFMQPANKMTPHSAQSCRLDATHGHPHNENLRRFIENDSVRQSFRETAEWASCCENACTSIEKNGEREWSSALMEAERQFQDIDITFRTNASFVEEEKWKRELIDLYSQLTKIDQISQSRTVYSILKKPDAFYLDFLKDIPLNFLEEVVTDDKEVFVQLKNHPLAKVFPVRFYEDKRISLQNVYALNTHITELLSPKVYMKSGAYLMIEPTEALVSIDVNTGKAEKNTEPEEFYFRTNMEAVKEVCYQLSARNLSGMILVDFINMKDREHIKQLLDALKAETAKDSVPTCFIDYTRLGLAELTRKKISRTLQEIMREWSMKNRTEANE